MKDKIKELLAPHFGYLDFLMKLSKDCTFNEIVKVNEYLKDKNLIKSLPKPIHSYDNYYSFIFAVYDTKIKFDVNKFIKNNTANHAKTQFLELVKDKKYLKIFNNIIHNLDMTNSFLSYSSRIKDIESAKTYVESIIKDENYIDKMFSEYGIVKLTDYKSQKSLLPSCWCIHTYKSQFDSHIKQQTIYLIKYDGKIYGVNYKKNGQLDYIQNDNNSSISRNGNIFKEIKEIMKNYFKMNNISVGQEKVNLFEKARQRNHNEHRNYDNYVIYDNYE